MIKVEDLKCGDDGWYALEKVPVPNVSHVDPEGQCPSFVLLAINYGPNDNRIKKLLARRLS